jgi:Fe-S cluster biogenesis protein NfuA
MKNNMESKIQKIIEKMRPYVNMHGGDVEFVSLNDGIVKIKVTGACANCGLSKMTYNDMLGSMIKEEVPEIKDIVIEN